VETLIQLTQSHREIWETLLSRPDLFRVLKPDADIKVRPVTDSEKLVVVLVVLHLHAAFEASKNGVVVPLEGMARDIKTVFSLPIPRAVWEDVRPFQNAKFVAFVESHFDPVAPIWKGRRPR